MKKKNTTIQIRIEDNIKKEARKVLESLGLDLSSGIELYLKTVIREGRVPFEVKLKKGDVTKKGEGVIEKQNNKTSRLNDNSSNEDKKSEKKGILQRLYR